MPESLRSIGCHIRAARIKRGLMQKELAELLGVTKFTIWNWEAKRSSPPTHQCAKVIEFLGYDPFPEPKTLAERMVAYRRKNGLRVKDAARIAGVDPCSWTSWEREEHRITSRYRDILEGLLSGKCSSPNELHR